MHNITHEHVRQLVDSLPRNLRDEFFMWRRARVGELRLKARKPGTAHFDWAAPEFIAECMQQALTLQGDVQDRINRWGA